MAKKKICGAEIHNILILRKLYIRLLNMKSDLINFFIFFYLKQVLIKCLYTYERVSYAAPFDMFIVYLC